MITEQRAYRRENLVMALRMADGSSAVTRDISPHGLYFTARAGLRPQRWVQVEVELPHAGLRFLADGEVVRLEPGADFTGVALKLHGGRLLPLD